jgi:hypothetical protein
MKIRRGVEPIRRADRRGGARRRNAANQDGRRGPIATFEYERCPPVFDFPVGVNHGVSISTSSIM